MNRLRSEDCAPIRLEDAVPGRDYAFLEVHRPSRVADQENPPTYLRRVTVESVDDGWALVTAREPIVTVRIGSRSIEPGDTFRVQFLGKPWDDVGARVDAERTIQRLRTDGITRISKAVPSSAERRLGYTSVDVQGMLDLLDEHERKQAVIDDLHHRLDAMTRERDHALAAVDEYEQADVLGALDRAALVIGGDEPDRSAERVDDERARWTA